MVPCLSEIDEEQIRAHLASDHFFWLDLTAPNRDDLEQLRRIFEFHPLALQDTEEFGQRPKLDDYDDYVFLVYYGAYRDHPADAEPVARGPHVHLRPVPRHRAPHPLPLLERQREQLTGRVLHSEQFLIYRVLDTLTDSFFPLLSDMDDEIDTLEASIVAGPDRSRPSSGCSRSSASS